MAKQAAFVAVKNVIEQGIEIHYERNHKGNDFNTSTFAAPVNFGNEKIAMAVIVKSYESISRGRPSYYIHEICDGLGNHIVLDENGDVTKKPVSANLPINASASTGYTGKISPVVVLSQTLEESNTSS